MIKNAIDFIKESVDNRLEKDRTEKYSNYENGKIEENPNPYLKTDRIEELWENTPVKEISELSEDEIVKKSNIEEIENKLDYSCVSEVTDPEKVYAGEEVKGCPIEDNGGNWEGQRGNSKWIPKDDEIPAKNNPENLTWGEIKKKHNIDGIDFKDGEPDFSEVSKATVEIDDFTENRNDNFYQADEKLAKEQGKTVSEVRAWRKENKYTWHECSDCKTMELVPSEVHGNVSHQGGISEIKNK